MIVGVEHVERGAVGANGARVVELRLVAGAVLVALFASPRNRGGLHRGNIDLANHVIPSVRDVNRLLVDGGSARTTEHRFGRVALGLPACSSLPGDRLV